VSGLFPEAQRTGVWWRDHSLSLVLAVVLVVQLAMVLGFGWLHYSSTQEAHAQPVEITGYLVEVAAFELPLSLVADTYGVLLVVLLTKWLREQGSEESR
jgi:flagellar basal body-associated protein FliL